MIRFMLAFCLMCSAANAQESNKVYDLRYFSDLDYLKLVVAFHPTPEAIRQYLPRIKTDNPFQDKRDNEAQLQRILEIARNEYGGTRIDDIAFVLNDVPTKIGNYQDYVKGFFFCLPGEWRGKGFGRIRVTNDRYAHTSASECIGFLPGSDRVKYSGHQVARFDNLDKAEEFYNLAYGKPLTFSAQCNGFFFVGNNTHSMQCVYESFYLYLNGSRIVSFKWNGNGYDTIPNF